MQPQQPHALRVELVNTARSRLRVTDQARILEDAQMLRNRGPAHRKHPRQLIHRQRPGGKLLEDGHASGIAERFESGL